MVSLPPAIAAGIDTALDRTVAPGYLRTGLALRRRLPTWPADPAPGALRGKVAAVTGATSGLGLATAEGLLRLGAEVLLVGRNSEKTEGVARDLRARLPGARVSVARCDVGDLDDVRRFVDELEVGHLDVLVHNAGAMPPERAESPQGHELSMARAPARPGADDRAAAPAAARRARAAGDLRRHVRPAAARRRPGVPRGRLLPDHVVRPQQAGAGGAGAAARRSGGAATASRCTSPTPAGRTPPAWSTRCRASTR